MAPGDSATFNTSAVTSLSLSAGVTIESITFNPGASAFTINTNGNGLTPEGTGIVNNSGQTQTITNPTGGATSFQNSAKEGNATIITSAGGMTAFFNASDGGMARAITNGNGRFDISPLETAGMQIGSIEGSGDYFLGGKTLTVGGNDLSTTVSGVIQDGGESGGSGGSLTKVGTGTLTLYSKGSRVRLPQWP